MILRASKTPQEFLFLFNEVPVKDISEFVLKAFFG